MEIQMSGFYSFKQVCELTTFSSSTIRRLVKAGNFPKPIQISTRRIGWNREAIISWLASKSVRQFARKLDDKVFNFTAVEKP